MKKMIFLLMIAFSCVNVGFAAPATTVSSNGAAAYFQQRHPMAKKPMHKKHHHKKPHHKKRRPHRH